MMAPARSNPAYRAINKPLMVGGVERRMFGVAMIGSLLVLIAFGMTGAAIVFAILFTSARRVTKQDPQILRVILGSRRFRTVYDPAKLEWYPIR